MKPITVLLVDDHVLFRKGLAGLLSGVETFQVVGEAGDGLTAVDKARQLRPDVVLMDVHMPTCDGLQATRLLREQVPEARVVMLTVSDEDADLFDAIKSGARGYLLKNLEPDELFSSLEGVMRGEAPISPAMAARILDELAREGWQASPIAPAPSNLTARERQILQLVVSGASNRQIAAKLFITEGTVKNHLHNILDKLHLDNRVQAASFAWRHGIVPDVEGMY